jgi:hydrogenase nickel incorporation protein HypB
MNAPVISHRFHDQNPIERLNRAALREAGVLAVSILGGPGCGKTTLITATVERLMPDVHVGVIACDIGSHRDADRIACVSEQVVQVNTCDAGGAVDATHIRDALRWLDLNWLDLLLIEQVGTLAVADAPHVGQDASVTMFSVAAGDDKADKHPELVQAADAVVLNKTDLLPSVPFDLAAFRKDVARIKPGVELIELSAVKQEGLERWIKWLRSRVAQRETPKAAHWFG